MDADSSINDWCSDDASQSQPCDFADSEGEHSQQPTLTRRSQLRPAGNGLAFVPYADWRPGRSFNQQPAENIWYDVEDASLKCSRSLEYCLIPLVADDGQSVIALHTFIFLP